MSKRTIWTLLSLVGILLVFSLWFTQTRNPSGVDPNQYVLRLKWLHQAQFAGFYEAQDNQLYSKAGITIDIKPGGPDIPAIKTVTSGKEDFGITGADQILLAISEGYPIVPLFVVYRESPFILFARSELNITKPEDFRSRKIGVKRGGNEELIYRALLQRRGVKLPEESEIPVQFDLSPFLAKKVDIWPGYAINEPLAAEESGVMVETIKPSDFGVSLYADTAFTTKKMIRDNPNAVRAFIKASLAGWELAVANPEEAGRVSLRYASESSASHQIKMMKASIPYIIPDGKGVGVMTREGWERTQSLLLDGKFLQKPVDLDDMLNEARSAGAPVQ